MNKKYCIVSGIGGFNDFFSTFFTACRRLEIAKLKYSIDIKLAVYWHQMGDEFWDFFQPVDDLIIEKTSDIDLENISNYKPYPFKYSYGKKNEGKLYISHKTRPKPEDTVFDSDWEIFVEYFTGQWNYSSFFPRYLSLTDKLKQNIKNAHKILDDGDYICLNFRMQEYIKHVYGIEQADKYLDIKLKEYSDKIEKCIQNTNKKILLCTDSVCLIKKFVDDKKVFSFGYCKKILDNNSEIDLLNIRHLGIHMFPKKVGLSTYDVCEAGFLDYFLMATSKVLEPAEFGNFGKGALNLKIFLDENPDIKKGWI